MPVPILPTKLYIPPPRADLVARPRLLDRLDAGLVAGRRLSLIAAPAGFGKTTLVTAWLYSAHRPIAARAVAWLSLDEGDADPARFFAHLIAALQQIDGGVGRAAQSLLGTPQPPALTSWVTSLISDLTRVDTPFVLVLDDYHLVAASPAHEAVSFLIEHAPPLAHVVILSRDEPGFALARMRVRGEVTEIGARDLRFTRDEVAAFLRRPSAGGSAAPHDWTPQQVEAIAARTEGWPAGVQLLALSLRRRGDEALPTDLDSLTGDRRYVADYLVSEVLERQPQPVREFLLHTAILDTMTAPLCDALTGRGDSARLLAELDAANLFIVALDDRGIWYRYHRLFAEVLRDRLPEATQTRLHHRAMDWYQAHGLQARAIDHALALGRITGDLADAERLIRVAAEPTARRGELLTARSWLDALPDVRVRADGQMATDKGWILAMSGDLAGAAEYAAAAEAAFCEADVDACAHDGGLRRNLGKLRALRGFVVLLSDRTYASPLLSSVVELTQDALDLLAEDQGPWRVLALWSQAEALERLDRVAEATATLREAQRLGRTIHETLFVIVAEGGLVKSLNDQGRRREALVTCAEAIEHYTGPDGVALPLAGLLYSQLGVLHYEGGALDAAEAAHARAIALAEQLGLAYELTYAHALAAPTWHAQGRSDAALAALQAGYRHASQHGYADVGWFAAWEANIRLRQGDFVFARKWAEHAGFTPRDTPGLMRMEPHLTYARVLLVRRRLPEARQWLARLEVFCREHGLFRWLITTLILQAIAVDRLGDRQSACDLLASALRMAAPEGYVRAFLDEEARVRTLLRDLREVAPAFVDQVLAAPGAAGYPAGALPPLAEPLTDRELEVLHLIAAGFSNQEIAERLVIARGTVKRHINNLYGKLHAHRRTEAVARARELGLI